MSLISDKMNQYVLYKRRRGYDDTGAPLYDAPVSIPCRIADDRRTVKDESGNEVVSEQVLYTEQRINPADAFVIGRREIPVIRVSAKESLFGGYDHTEVRL